LTIHTLDDQNFMKNLAKFSKIKVIKTGEIYEIYEYERPYFYNLGVHLNNGVEKEIVKIDRKDSILRAQAKVRRLVNANAFVYGYMPIFVTYTFAENLRDIKVANKLFRAHIRAMKQKHVPNLRYLAVPERQKRGAVHYHVVFFDLPFMQGIKSIFEANWEHGFLQVKAIKHVRNVGAYISKYFSKGWLDEREKGSKSYFTSEGLFQPLVFHSLDRIPSLDTMREESETVYETEKYGRIVYRQFRNYQLS